VGEPQQELGGTPQRDPLPLCCQAGQSLSHGVHHLQDIHGQTECSAAWSCSYFKLLLGRRMERNEAQVCMFVGGVLA